MPTKEIETHLRANLNMSRKDIMVSNFLGGLSWGFGSVVGATVVIGILGAFLNHLGVFDGIKAFFDSLPRLR